MQKWPKGFASPHGHVLLTGDDLARFLEWMDAHKAELEVDEPVVQLWQQAGEMVVIPPGWVHQVENLKPNLKLAWDICNLDKVHHYVRVQQAIVAPVFKEGMSPDMMSVNMVLHEVVK